MQRSKMHSVSIFLLLQGVIVRGKDGAAREEDLLKMKVSSLAGQALFLPPFLILVRLVSRRFALRILYNIVCVEGGNQLFENFHAFPCCFNSDVSGVFLVPHFPDFIISLRVDRIPILFGHDLRGLLSPAAVISSNRNSVMTRWKRDRMTRSDVIVRMPYPEK